MDKKQAKVYHHVGCYQNATCHFNNFPHLPNAPLKNPQIFNTFHSFVNFDSITKQFHCVYLCAKMWRQTKNDVESGTSEPLYPMMLEAPELRWAFIRKIYSVVAIQLILTVVVAAVVVSFRPISAFFTTTSAGLFLYILLIFTPFVGKFQYI